MGPLQGLRILDFTVAVYGGLATQMLGDLGAEVVKVERPDQEEVDLGPVYRSPGKERPTWLAVNRSKKSIAVDLRQEEGREIVRQLVRGSDAVCHNFRAGVMDRMGLGYEPVRSLNPRIVYGSFYSFGETGPLAHRIGADRWAQAMGGVVSIQGSPEGPAYQAGVAFADQGGACICAFGMVVALLARERTGVGQEITSNMLNAVMHLQTLEISDYLMGGHLLWKAGRGWRGGVPDGPYRARDRDVMMMIMGQWATFCRVMGLEELADDPRFATEEARQRQREALYAYLDPAFQQRTAAEWQELFRAEKMRCDPCLTYRELCDHPQVQANEMVTTVDHPKLGPLRMLGVPVRFKGTPDTVPGPPPLLGEHTEEILLGLGYPPERIREMEANRVVRIARPAQRANMILQKES